MVVYLKEQFHPDAEALLRANATVVDNLDNPRPSTPCSCAATRSPRR